MFFYFFPVFSLQIWILFPPQGPKSIRFRLFPVALPSQWSTLNLQLQRPFDQAHLSHTRALWTWRWWRFIACSHTQRREPRSRSRSRGAYRRQPRAHEECLRLAEVTQPGRDKQPVRVFSLAQPQFNWTRHAVTYGRRAATGAKGQHPHPAAVFQEESAGGGQWLHGRRHGFHCQPQETHLQDLQETEEIKSYMNLRLVNAIWIYFFFFSAFGEIRFFLCLLLAPRCHKLFPMHLFVGTDSEKLDCGSN